MVIPTKSGKQVAHLSNNAGLIMNSLAKQKRKVTPLPTSMRSKFAGVLRSFTIPAVPSFSVLSDMMILKRTKKLIHSNGFKA